MKIQQYNNNKLIIIDYHSLSINKKKNLIQDLNRIGFPSYSYTNLLEYFNQSSKNRLPQYYFIYYQETLIGYCLLIGEKPNDYFSWWITHNMDTMHRDNAIYLYHYFIKECQQLNWINGVKFFKEQIIDFGTKEYFYEGFVEELKD